MAVKTICGREYIPLPRSAEQRERKRFIAGFADKDLPYYRCIMGLEDCYGVSAACGFIWEVVRPYNRISFDGALAEVERRGELMLMWDKSTAKSRGAAVNGHMPRSGIIRMNGADIAFCIRDMRSFYPDKSNFLPRDLYVFDNELSFFVIFTQVNDPVLGLLCMTNLPVEESEPARGIAEMLRVTGAGKGGH